MSSQAAVRAGVPGRERPGGARPYAAPAAPGRTRPHVCFVAPYAWPVLSRDPRIQVVGGAEVQQTILARLFVRAGYRVSMICLDFGQPARTEVDGVTVHRIYRPEEGIPVLRFVHPRLTSMWRALQEADADIYYHRSSALWTGIVAEFARRRGRRTIFAGASDKDFSPGEEQISLARDRWLFQHGVRSVDHVVVQNRAQLEACRANYGREPTLIPSCYELPESRVGGKADRVLWCGTVHKYKRPEILLGIARRLPHRRFVIVGGPGVDETQRAPYFEGIRAQAQALPNVEFTGFLPLAQVEPWFDRARVLVNTSDYEGMPNTFMQAWARGVPTVATVDVGAGIYKVFEQVDDAVAEIERLFDDEPYYQAASARTLEYFERNHSTREVLARYAKVFDELMEKR